MIPVVSPVQTKEAPALLDLCAAAVGKHIPNIKNNQEIKSSVPAELFEMLVEHQRVNSLSFKAIEASKVGYENAHTSIKDVVDSMTINGARMTAKAIQLAAVAMFILGYHGLGNDESNGRMTQHIALAIIGFLVLRIANTFEVTLEVTQDTDQATQTLSGLRPVRAACAAVEATKATAKHFLG